MLDYLDVAFNRREAALGTKPAGIERYSPSGRIPLLVHEGLTISESRVILDYLAGRYGFADAYPDDLVPRTRHRYAIAVADDVLAPLLFPGAVADNELRTTEVLDAMEAATATVRPGASMLAMHLGPLWFAFRAWHPGGPTTRAIRARPALHEWLEAAAALPFVTRSATDPAIVARDLRRARDAGLIPEAV